MEQTLPTNHIQRIHTNSKVRIVEETGDHGVIRYNVINECNDVLYRSARRHRCYVWCRKNRCQPVQADWDTLEERWSILNWFNHHALPNFPGFIDAKKRYVSRGGKFLLVLWDHNQAQGWHVYIRTNPRKSKYQYFAQAGRDSLRWRMNEAIYWAESTLWVGMDRPDGTSETEKKLQEAYDLAHASDQEWAPFMKPIKD